jgi:PHD/YefM family antitoxin component YafN of YafNO toxin-antitoxin module
MKTIQEKTTLVAVSELRTKMDQVLEALKHSTVMIERRHRPIAVLLDVEYYRQLDRMMERISDVLLAVEARERARSGTPKKDLTLDEVEKRLRS